MKEVGMVPQMGLMALGGAGNSAINSGTAVDGSWDWGSSLAGLGGLAGGAGIGALAGRYASGAKGRLTAKQADELKKIQKALKSTKGKARSPLIAQMEKLNTGPTGKLGAGKGKALTWLAENPKLAMMGGAGLGGLMGATMLAKAVSGPRDNLMAQQQQSYAQQDAQNQMRDMQLAYGGGGKNW